MKNKQKTGKRKRGRPRKIFTDEQMEIIRELAHNNCNTKTIAECVGVDRDTLKRHFAQEMIKWRSEGKRDLLATQFKLAKSSPQMAIFLGKNYLDQRDRQDVHTNTERTRELTEAEYEEARRLAAIRLQQPA